MRTIAIYNIKGGVGKTSTAVNLAYLASKNANVLFWDLDSQGASTFYFDKKVKNRRGISELEKKGLFKSIKSTNITNLDLIPADFKYRNIDIELSQQDKPKKYLSKFTNSLKNSKYDLLFLDCPPTRSLISENIFQASDYIIVPTIPTTLSIRTYNQIVEYIESTGNSNSIYTFLSMVDNRKKLHRELSKDIKDALEHRELLDTVIPNSIHIEQMGLYLEPVHRFAPYSAGAKAYQSLWDEINHIIHGSRGD